LPSSTTYYLKEKIGLRTTLIIKQKAYAAQCKTSDVFHIYYRLDHEKL